MRSRFLISLFSLFVFLGPALAQEDLSEKSARIANSITWKRLLYFENGKSLAVHERFFLSPNGKYSLIDELHSAYQSFFSNENVTSKDKQKKKCIFPARYLYLAKQFGKKADLSDCQDYQNWYKGLAPNKLFLVYSSAYPNNPASMFGHTFLRFDRELETDNQNTRDLLGYSIAHQAHSNPSDNPVMYALKGIFGGYHAFLEINPYYMNIGIYNNSESRDLWEYPIPLKQDEIDFLTAHLWEVSLNTGFDYFFFDENCSTFVLRMLEIIKPEWEFKTKYGFFVVPQETLKEVVELTGEGPTVRPSIKKKIEHKFTSMTLKEQQIFSQSLKSIEKLEEVENPLILDTLVDHWKLKNYKEKVNLSKKDQMLFITTLNQRAATDVLIELDKERIIHNSRLETPHLGHKRHRFFISGRENLQQFEASYGFHRIDDPFLGYRPQSMIEILRLRVHKEKDEFYLSELRLIEILSLENFYFAYPNFSWNVLSGFRRSNHRSGDHGFLEGGLGLSYSSLWWQIYSFPSLSFEYNASNGESDLRPYLKTGLKINPDPFFLLSEFRLVPNRSESAIKTELFLRQGNFMYGTEYLADLKNDHHTLSLKLVFYL